MPDINAGDKTIHYSESGQGAPYVFVHGSFAKSSAWRSVIDSMDMSQQRAIAVNLTGCGGTSEAASDGTLLGQDIAVIESAVQAACQGPIHLVGHSYGGIVCLGAALAKNIEIASLTLFEPLPLAFLAQTGDTHVLDEVAAFIDAYDAAFKAGEKWAFSRVITLWGGPGAFDAMPTKVRDAMAPGTAANLRQWQDNLRFQPSAQAYRALAMPTTIVVGQQANPICNVIGARLSDLMVNAYVHTLPGAGHFMIHSHAPQCAALLPQP